MPEDHGGTHTYSQRSLHGQVAHDIGGRILRGELTPGETLPNVGAKVWIEFENGDVDYPIWSGCWYDSTAETPPSLRNSE